MLQIDDVTVDDVTRLFGCAFQVNKKLADAYFWRGVTKVKLRMPRSVQDFNKSLAIDPTLFQVGVTSHNDVTH